MVEQGLAGLLSTPGDVTGLADNITTLLRDPELRTQMGAYGREQVQERFTVEHLAEAMAGIYERVAN